MINPRIPITLSHMRDAFHDELDAITQTLVDMAMLVKNATKDSTTALLTADLALAEKVIAQDDVIDRTDVHLTWIQTLPAGAHTIKAQWRVDGNTGHNRPASDLE